MATASVNAFVYARALIGNVNENPCHRVYTFASNRIALLISSFCIEIGRRDLNITHL